MNCMNCGAFLADKDLGYCPHCGATSRSRKKVEYLSNFITIREGSIRDLSELLTV